MDLGIQKHEHRNSHQICSSVTPPSLTKSLPLSPQPLTYPDLVSTTLWASKWDLAPPHSPELQPAHLRLPLFPDSKQSPLASGRADRRRKLRNEAFRSRGTRSDGKCCCLAPNSTFFPHSFLRAPIWVRRKTDALPPVDCKTYILSC